MSEQIQIKSREQINAVFKEQQTFELWMMITFKFLTSLIFLIDDLTFLLYCEYEYHMTQSEAGMLFCGTALCLFTYGLFISGFVIDKLGIKVSLNIGLSLYALGKFMLIFADSRFQLYLVMLTVMPLGISIIFPSLVLAVKRLCKENARPQAFSTFYAAMILGAVLGGWLDDRVGPKIVISTTRIAPVGIVFPSSATATFPPASRSAMMPEPTTVARSEKVPSHSAISRRSSVILHPPVVPQIVQGRYCPR